MPKVVKVEPQYTVLSRVLVTLGCKHNTTLSYVNGREPALGSSMPCPACDDEETERINSLWHINKRAKIEGV